MRPCISIGFSVVQGCNAEAAGLPQKPLPSLVEAAELSSSRAQEREKGSTERHQAPLKATAVAVGKPVTEILQPSADPAAQPRQQPLPSKPPPKAPITRKQLGIKALPGVKLRPKQ